ncbi:MAG: hypothetical protein ACI8PQ_000593 [Planctomycetota bacterium]|jgi:hypothetical protein
MPENLDLLVSDVLPVSIGTALASSPEEHARRQAGKLYSDGMTLGEVADALGCSLPLARKMVQEAGVEIRRPGAGRRKKTQGLEKLPGLTWLPSDDDFMTQERRRMLRYMVVEKDMGWAACLKGLAVNAEVLKGDLLALGLRLENQSGVELQEPEAPKPLARRGRRLKDANHLVEDLATMRSMENQGTPHSDIGQLFGLSVMTVKKRLAMTEEDVRLQMLDDEA